MLQPHVLRQDTSAADSISASFTNNKMSTEANENTLSDDEKKQEQINTFQDICNSTPQNSSIIKKTIVQLCRCQAELTNFIDAQPMTDQEKSRAQLIDPRLKAITEYISRNVESMH